MLFKSLGGGQISFSVVNGEPYVKVGADTPRPFNSGAIYLKNVPCSVAGTLSSSNFYPKLNINISGLYANYKNITPKEVFVNKTNANATINWFQSVPTMSYNASTGVITLSTTNNYGVINVTSANIVIII